MPLIAICLITSGLAGSAGDWPNYRGPTHDGVSAEFIRTNWTDVAPQQLWKVSVGAALSSMTVKDGRVFTMERHGDTITGREFCIALDANTGTKLWETDIISPIIRTQESEVMMDLVRRRQLMVTASTCWGHICNLYV